MHIPQTEALKRAAAAQINIECTKSPALTVVVLVLSHIFWFGRAPSKKHIPSITSISNYTDQTIEISKERQMNIWRERLGKRKASISVDGSERNRRKIQCAFLNTLVDDDTKPAGVAAVQDLMLCRPMPNGKAETNANADLAELARIVPEKYQANPQQVLAAGTADNTVGASNEIDRVLGAESTGLDLQLGTKLKKAGSECDMGGKQLRKHARSTTQLEQLGSDFMDWMVGLTTACFNAAQDQVGKLIAERRAEYEANAGHWDKCFVCKDGGDLLCCDRCMNAVHLECVNLTTEPSGDWLCDECQSIYMCEMCKAVLEFNAEICTDCQEKEMSKGPSTKRRKRGE